MSYAVPSDFKARHSVGKRRVYYVGANLVRVANEFLGAAENLFVKLFALFFSIVDILYMAVVGRYAVSYNVICVIERISSLS